MLNRAKTILLVGAMLYCGAVAFAGTAQAQDQKGRNKIRHVSVFDDPKAPVFHYTESAEQIRKVLPSAYENLGLPGARDAKEDSIYLTPYLKITGALYQGELNSKYFDCGEAVGKELAADVYEITFALMTVTRSETAGGSSIRVLLNGYARDKRTRSSAEAVDCYGTGLLEKNLDKLIRLHIRQDQH